MFTARAVVALALACSAGSMARADIPNGTCEGAFEATSELTSVPTGQSSATNTNQTPCGLIQHAAWYYFIASAPGTLSVAVSPSNFKTNAIIAVYPFCGSDSEACAASSAVAAGTVSLPMVAGQGYAFVVGWNADGASPAPDDVTNVTAAFVVDSCGTVDPTRSCCYGGDWRECGTPACCAAICRLDPICCDEVWDWTCSELVRTTCQICLSPDCDQDGDNDAAQYGTDPHLLLPTSINSKQLYTAENRYCPNTPLTTSSTLVVRGRLQDGYRTVGLPYGDGATLSGLRLQDAKALVYGDDGQSPLTVANDITVNAARQSATVIFSDVEISAAAINLTLGKSVSPGAEPTLQLLNCDGFTDELNVDAGQCTIGGVKSTSRLESDRLFVGPDAAMVVEAGSELQLFGASEVRGLLRVNDAGTVRSLGQPILGSLPSSWLRGEGTIDASVGWRGCVKPEGQLSVLGNFEFGKYGESESSRYLWRLNQAPGASIAVSGTAILRGTLLIDASNAQIGDSALIMSATEFIGDFKNIQTIGLPPQFALVVFRASGGVTEQIRATVVPVGVLLGFGGNSQYPLPLEPKDSVRGDLNGDGVDDVAVSLSAGETVSGAVIVFLGDGKGLVQSTQVGTGKDPRGIAAADFDLDSKLDLVVALRGDDAVQVLRNTGSGGTPTFNASGLIPVGDRPVDVATGDFLPDLASLQGGIRKDALVAVEGDGTFVSLKNTDGTLSSNGGTTTPSPGGVPTSVEGGDIDNDRVDDGVGGSTGGTTVIPGGTSGSFGAQGVIFIPTPNPVTSLIVADATGDGVDDILATLAATAPRPTPPETPAVFDTLALVNKGALGLEINLYDFGYLGSSIAKGDFDADGDQDLAFVAKDELNGSNMLRVVRNDQSASGALLTQLSPPALPSEPTLVQTVSIDGNGDD
ncbi:MAG: VCBS repeat-containing protein, partial [Planctomycetaceae bacterium]|nr:VCBS repeat-containing protein [Planctomycetaceae bacterium]